MKQKSKQKVLCCMGSQSDYPAMQAAENILTQFGVACDVMILSAHRTPDQMFSVAKAAHEKYDVIIAAAGGAAHLPGMIASLTVLPVIGIPVSQGKLSGLDSLLSIVQMPAGIPVATMAIDNATNAGLMALRILALNNLNLKKKLEKYHQSLETKVARMRSELKKVRTKAKKLTNKKSPKI